MATVHPMQRSFNAGEWSPKMDGQVDHDKYQYACRKMENFISLVQGPAKSRPGTRYVDSAKYGTKVSRLIPFVFSNSQAYVIEFGDLYIRFYMNRAQITSGGVPYEVATPYLAAEVWELQWVQSADVMYIFHPLHPTQKLSRTAHAAWTLVPAPWKDGPYLQENTDRTIHLKAAAKTGTGIAVFACYEYDATTFGTDDGTPAAAVPVMTTGLNVGGLRFKAPTDGLLQSVVINVAAAAVADPDTMSMTLYSDVSGSPDTLIATCDAAQDIHTTGDKTFTFADIALTKDVHYWLCFSASAPDDAITLAAVAHAAAYGSGTHATAITSITDNLGAAGEFKVEITYQPTGSADIFQAGHVGSRWRVRHSGGSVRKTFTTAETGPAVKFLGTFTVDITVNSSWDGHLDLEKSFNQITWVRVAGFSTSTKQEFFEPEGAYYRLRNVTASSGSGSAATDMYQIEHWGSFEITSIVTAHSVLVTIINDLHALTSTPYWREGAFSDVRGYPRTGCFRDERLWLAGTAYQPQTLWGSWVGDYENMTPHTTDDAAVQFDLVDFCNPILWITSHGSFLAGSCGEEGRLSTRKTEPISGSNPINCEIQTTHGTQLYTHPIKVGPAVLFVQQGGHKIREATYALESNAYVATDLSILAEHIPAAGIVDFCYQQEPYSIVWCVMSDGTLAGLTYYPIEKVIGWHRHPFSAGAGTVESCCCVPAYTGDTENTRSELYLLRRIVVNGSIVRYVEVMTLHENVTDQAIYFCVECGLTYYSATVPVSSVWGLDHLAGKTVAIQADGAPQAQREVVQDPDTHLWGVELDEGTLAYRVHVGLPYTCKLQPMRIEAGAQDGTAQARLKEIEKVTVRLLGSATGKIGTCDDDLVDISPYIEGTYLADTAPGLLTGDTAADGWPGNSDYNGDILIVQDQPVPMTVVAIMPVVTCND